jgi:hypothetical protein
MSSKTRVLYDIQETNKYVFSNNARKFVYINDNDKPDLMEQKNFYTNYLCYFSIKKVQVEETIKNKKVAVEGYKFIDMKGRALYGGGDKSDDVFYVYQKKYVSGEKLINGNILNFKCLPDGYLVKSIKTNRFLVSDENGIVSTEAYDRSKKHKNENAIWYVYEPDWLQNGNVVSFQKYNKLSKIYFGVDRVKKFLIPPIVWKKNHHKRTIT